MPDRHGDAATPARTGRAGRGPRTNPARSPVGRHVRPGSPAPDDLPLAPESADLFDPPIDTAAAEEERRAIFASLLAEDPFEDEEPELPAGPPPYVTAVLVAHDGARWLPTTLAGLRVQTRAPDRVVAVDTGSEDASGRFLERAFGAEDVVRLPRGSSYGAAVEAALAARPVPDAGAERREWVWLLHDDSAPHATALERLLDHAGHNPSIGVLGAKAVDWDHPDRLVDVGLSTDAAGRRVTYLDRGELDQGQHDQPRDVLAVGTAGALVRRDVWDALGGFDPDLPVLREDVDFGWRAHRSGHRVVIVPAARVRHARALLAGTRHSAHVRESVRRTDRAHALFVGVANTSLLRLPRSLAGALVRCLVLLLTRRPSAAWDELLAGLALLTGARRLVAARRRRRGRFSAPASAVRPYLGHSAARVRALLLATTDRLSGSGELAVGSDLDDESVPDDDSGVVRRVFLRPVVGLVVGLTLVALIADRHLLHGGALVGGRLLAMPGGATDLWHAYVAGWHDVAAGSGSPAAPWLPVVAVVSYPFGANPALAMTVLVLGAVPLAGLSAWFATRRAHLGPALRCWAAVTYALLPPVTGAVDGGRFDTVVAVVAAPLLVAGAARMLRRGGRPNHAFALGLGLAVTAAFAPPVWTIAALVLAVAVAASWLRVPGSGTDTVRTALRRTRDAVLVLVTPALALIPWTFSVPAHPQALLTGLGVPGGLAATTGRAAGAAQLLLLSPGGHTPVPLWFVAPLLVAAVVATLRTGRTVVALAAWAVVGGALGVGLAAARIAVGPGTPPAHGDVGTALAVAGAGVLAAALVAARDARRALRSAAFGVRQPLVALLAVACLAVPAASAGWLLARGSGTPLHRQDVSSLPPNVVDDARYNDPGQRVLWLRDERGALGYALEPVVGSRAGDEDLRGSGTTRTLLDALVADLGSDRGTDAAETLATFHIRYVALESSAAGTFAPVLDRQPALSRYALPGSALLWRVLVPSARAEVLTGPVAAAAAAPEPASAPLGRGPLVSQLRTAPVVPVASGRTGVSATVPAGQGRRLLVLADSASPHWHATVDGRPVPGVLAWGWAQAFALPAGSGHVVVRYDDTARHAELWAQLGVLLVLVVLAAPGVRRYEDEPPGPVAASLDPDEMWDLDDLADDASDHEGVRP